MKYSVRFFVVTFLLLVCTYATAEQKVVYLDMKYILNNSKAGKGAQDFLQKTFKENQKKFSDMENEFKKEEAALLSKKNDLSNEEYQKRSDELRKKVFEYQSERRSSLEKITRQRTEARQKLMEKVDPIVNSYMKENDVSLVLDKKDVLAGRFDLDITEVVVEKLNKELLSLNLK